MAFFNELGTVLNNVIGEKILRNQNICKLLYYYSDINEINFDPLAQPDIPDTSILLLDHVYPLPKIPKTEDKQEAFLLVTLSGGDRYSTDVNDGYRRIYLIFDIIAHLNQWLIKNSYRVYEIAEELDKMFNYQQTDLPILGRPTYVGFQQRDYSNYFYGLQLIYQFTVNSNIECNPLPQNLNMDSENIPPMFLSKVLGARK